MDNQTLTRQLMGYQGRTAYMSLMLDDKENPLAKTIFG